MWKKTINFCLYVFCGGIIIWLGGLIWFGYTINHYQVDLTTKTDAVVVLTGGRNRIAEGIKLLNMRLADKMFISGVSKNVSIRSIEKSSKIRATDESRIELGRNATNTIENAAEIASWIKQNNIKSIRFVTSNYHIMRSLAELSVYKLPIQIIVHPVYSEQVDSHWWNSWGTLKLIMLEYNKLLVVYILQALNFRRNKNDLHSFVAD